MTFDLTPVHRYYDAVRVVAERVGRSRNIPELLLRLGFPGLMTRVGVDPPVLSDPNLLRAQKLYHVIVLEESDRLSDALRTRRIQHFFAKGVALAGRVYEPGDRFLGDIDLYVPPGSRQETLQALAHLGYDRLPEGQQAGPPELRSALALARQPAGEITSVGVDLHWTLDPVDRILPRNDHQLPARIWESVVTTGRRNTPAPEHHAAILAHHLVHTDLLHVRGLLDLSFVFQEFDDEGGSEYLAVAADLGVRDMGHALARIMDRDLGVRRMKAGAGASPATTSTFLRRLNLVQWLVIVAGTDPNDENRITVNRIRRRLRVVDENAMRRLAADLFFPPSTFLEWRWGSPRWLARIRHLRQLARKMVRSA